MQQTFVIRLATNCAIFHYAHLNRYVIYNILHFDIKHYANSNPAMISHQIKPIDKEVYDLGGVSWLQLYLLLFYLALKQTLLRPYGNW